MPDITSGIIDFALHPPFNLVKQYLDGAGPYTGDLTLTTWSSTVGPVFTPQAINLTFGVVMQLVSVPAAFGMDIGWNNPSTGGREDIYHVRLAQLVVQHQLGTGLWVTTQEFHLHKFTDFMMWNVALPGRIGLLTAPGIEVDLYYLVPGGS